MPLKLIPPRPGKTPFYAVRGTHLGVSLDRSTKTGDRSLAQKLLQAWRGDIERGAYARPGAPSFASAATDYMNAGGEARFLPPIITHFGLQPLAQIDQKAIGDAAVALYPKAAPATRNRQVYSPVIAILRHAGVTDPFKRPKGAQGQRRTFFLSLDQAQRLIAAGYAQTPFFGALLVFLLYTGCRIEEATSLREGECHLDEGWAYVRTTKNGEPRAVYLPPVVVAALANIRDLPRNKRRGAEYLFPFSKCGRLYALLTAAEKASGVILPPRVAFHVFRHTYGAWMQRLGADLVGTGTWRNEKSASVYKHLEITIEAQKANDMPVVKVG